MTQLSFQFEDPDQAALFDKKTHKEKLHHVSLVHHKRSIHAKNHTRRKLTELFAADNDTYNQKRRPKFQMKLKKRRPLWKEALIFGATTMSAWALTHVGMNYPAFSQIVEFKAETLAASVISSVESLQTQEPEFVLVKKVKTPFRNKKIKPRNAAQKMFEKIDVYPSDNRIVLPRLGKNVPLIDVPTHNNWYQLEENIQSGLRDGVVVHPISRSPGAFGNFFVTGHSSYYEWDEGRYKDVFALLHELKEGDNVEVYWEGKKYVYKMKKQAVIPPTQTSVLSQPDDKSIITLMTCTPVGTNTNRLIWVGDLIKVE